MIRHGAKLVHAFAEATVPKVTVVLRKAFGGAFIAMNSRDLGADYTFAWPQAQLGVMGAKQAVTIVNRRDIAAADDPDAARDEFAAEYADEHLSAGTAAAEGYIDEVILPGDTRRRLSEALSTLDAIAQPGQRREEHPAMTPAITDTISWWAPFEALETGQEFTTRGRTVTEADVVGVRRADRRLAPAALATPSGRPSSPFGERIAHGMLVRLARRRASCRSTRAAWSRCAACATRRSSGPVRFGDTLRVEGRIAELGAGVRGGRAGDVRLERRQPGRAAPSAARASRSCGGATCSRRVEPERNGDFVPIPL